MYIYKGAKAVCLVCLVACNSSKQPEALPSKVIHSAKKAPLSVQETADASVAVSQPSEKVQVEPLPSPVSRRDVVAVTILSPRSLSMKLRLRGGIIKVFKPMRKNDPRARYEVAAYLMARLLQFDGVPPATMARLPLSLLKGRIAKDDPAIATRLEKEVVVDNRKWLAGAQIDWVHDLDPDGIERHGGMKVLKRWLSPGRPKESLEPMLSSKLSNVVVFDYLIGNWDRFSGGNIFINTDADGFILLDHNGSFVKWGAHRQGRMESRLARVERFSVSFLEKITLLNRSDIEKALSEVKDALLSSGQISLILQRRDEVLRHIEGLVKEKGRENILVFD